MLDLIKDQVVFKWRKYIQSKTRYREIDHPERPRNDTIWKKILRDAREFYRILYRCRFSPDQHKDIEGVKKTVNVFIAELNLLPYSEVQLEHKLYFYLHQTHKLTNAKLFGESIKKGSLAPYDAIEKYNEHNLKKIMVHPLLSRMFYFVYKNYLNVYYKVLNPGYREHVIMLINKVIKCYETMESSEDIEEIQLLLS